MAIYEYDCKDCGYHFDVRRSMQEADKPIDCPECGSSLTNRALSRFFTVTKGRAPAASTGGSSCSSCSQTSCGSCSAG